MLFGSASRGLPSFGDLSWKRPCPNVTVGALSANTLSPATGVSFGQTLEKTTNGALSGEANLFSLGGLNVGDRILVTGEASPKNGVWIITSLGSAGSKWKFTRATDADSAAELPTGTTVFDLVLLSLWITTGGAGGAFIQVPTQLASLLVLNDIIGQGNFDLPSGNMTLAGARPGTVVRGFVGSAIAGTATKTLNPQGITTVGGSLMPWAGKIVGINIRSSAARTAGTMTARAQINGAATGLTAALSASPTLENSAVTTHAAGASFAAGDRLGAQVVTAGWTPTGGDVLVEVFVIFDAVG